MPRGTDRYDEARLQGRLWDLTEVPGLSNYVNFNRRDSLSFSGSNIVGAKDLSRTGRDWTTSTTGPTLIGVNGSRNAASFTTTQLMFGKTTDFAVPLASTTYSVGILARIRAGGTSARVLNSNAINWLFGWWGGAGGQRNEWYDGTNFVNAAPDTDDKGNWHLITGVANAGVAKMSDNGLVVPGPYQPVHAGPGYLTINVGSEPSDCDVFAAFAYTTAVSDRDMRAIEGRLLWEAGFQDALPAGHPYKNRPPLIGA